MEIKILGLDPSMSNFGMAMGLLNLNDGSLNQLNLNLIEAPAEPKNKGVRQNSMDLERARSIYNRMTETIEAFKPDIICVEIPVGSQSARAMASYGMCIGLLASIQVPLIQVTPAEVKLAACKSKVATKQQMIEWATNAYPSANWCKRKLKGDIVLTDKNEHLADALGAIYAGVKTDQFKQLRAVYSKGISQ